MAYLHEAPRGSFGPYLSPSLARGLGEPPAGPDSPAAGAFVAAHRDRFCTPGQAGSRTCAALPNPRPIRRVVIHTATSTSNPPCGAPVPLANIIRAVQNAPNPDNPTSAHYYVDRNGAITQMVREANVAFHVIGHNGDSIGIEHADVCNKPDPYTRQLYESSAALVRDIAARNGFALSVFGINTNDAALATVLGHSTIGHHGDPGPYWDWEYYAALLRWDGANPRTRPFRFVGTTGAPAPAGWQAQNRAQVVGGTGVGGHADCIPNSHCANRNHSYSDVYWRAQASTPGTNVVFSIPIPPGAEGLYKVSLYWPNVAGANPATRVEVEVQKAGGNAMARGAFDQRTNNGRWNDLGGNMPFTFTVPAVGAQASVRILRASTSAGFVLADAVRILKVV